jgi:hypothetical protein
MCYPLPVCICTNNWEYVETAEVQAEEPENRLVPNGDAPKSHTVSLVEHFSVENDGASLENLESSESGHSQNLYLNVEAPDDGHILPGTGRRINCVLLNLCIVDKDNIRLFDDKYCLPTLTPGGSFFQR